MQVEPGSPQPVRGEDTVIPRIYRPATCIAQLLYTRILKAQASSLQSGDFIKDSFCKSAELELIKR